MRYLLLFTLMTGCAHSVIEEKHYHIYLCEDQVKEVVFTPLRVVGGK